MKKIVLAALIFFAFLLRTYNISHVPPALSWDEVSIGYNAYSILKTGKDEHGTFFPLAAFVAYGDYKPPFAIYLTVPSIALFGLNEFGVRFPSALLGTLTVLMTFFLVRELFKKSKNYELITNNLPLVSAALLAISPWHINLSRAGFEATIALFFVVFGTWLILKARYQPRMWLIAFIPYVLSMYTFNSSRYFVIIFSLGLLLFCWPAVRKNWKNVTLGCCIAGVMLLPLMPHLISKEARLRYTEVNIFTDPEIVKTANERIDREGNSIIGKIINNRRIGYARSYLVHFFDNIKPDFLFIKGDGNPKFSIQDVGQLYWIEAPFLIIGIFALLITNAHIALLLLFWIIAAIIPAAVARETPHALRILNSLPTWQIFIAFGILSCARFFKKIHSSALIAFLLLLSFAYLLNGMYYLHKYYRHYPIEFSGEWQYGYREALMAIQSIESKYTTIAISELIGRPYMYTLFYNEIDPIMFQRTKDARFDTAGFYHVYGFGKYRFISELPAQLDSQTLYIWDATTVPHGVRVLDTIRFLNGNPVLVIFDLGKVKL